MNESKTISERGYHITQAEIDTQKALALGKVVQAKQILEATRTKAQNLADELAGLSDILRSNPANIALDCYSDEKVLGYATLAGVVQDVITAQTELQEASNKARSLGVVV